MFAGTYKHLTMKTCYSNVRKKCFAFSKLSKIVDSRIQKLFDFWSVTIAFFLNKHIIKQINYIYNRSDAKLFDKSKKMIFQTYSDVNDKRTRNLNASKAVV